MCGEYFSTKHFIETQCSKIENKLFHPQMQNFSENFMSIKGAILQSIDDVELESLDTSTSTEGENSTPIASPLPLPMNKCDFESTIYELVDKQR